MSRTTCLECSSTLVGRSDKKFCNDNCRSAYNNRRNRPMTNLIRRTNLQLIKNYRILSELKSEGAMVNRSELSRRGYEFDLHTSLIEREKAGTVTFIYDLGLMRADGDKLMILKKKGELSPIASFEFESSL